MNPYSSSQRKSIARHKQFKHLQGPSLSWFGSETLPTIHALGTELLAGGAVLETVDSSRGVACLAEVRVGFEG